MYHVVVFQLLIVLLHNHHINQFHLDILYNAILYLSKDLPHKLNTVKKKKKEINFFLIPLHVLKIFYMHTLYPTCLYTKDEFCSFSAFTCFNNSICLNSGLSSIILFPASSSYKYEE